MDLESGTVTGSGVRATFEIDDFTRQRLLQGLDDIDLTLQHENAISAFERTRPPFLPTTA